MFDKQIKNFNENILALREFVDLIEPILLEKFKEHNSKISPLIMSGILNNQLKNPSDIEDEKLDKLKEEKIKVDEQIASLYNENLEVEFESVEANDNGLVMKKLSIKGAGDIDISEHFDNANKSSSHIDLLYTNSLISVLSSVEWFFSQILHYFYQSNPSASGISKKTLTLQEIQDLGSIEDAEKYLIDLKIEDILRSSFENWIETLKNELKLSMSYLSPHKNELVEAYQRRNLYVHNGGIINSIYFSKVDSSLTKDLKIGDKINLDKKYLDNTICKLHLTFILIASELWKKLDSDDKNRGDILTDIIYENILESRWEIAEGLSYFIIKDSKMDPLDKVVAQLNHWLCLKRQGKYEEIKSELQKADFSDKKNIFQLALHALKEEVEEFFELLPATLDGKELNTDRLEIFPIFKEMRETKNYEIFKAESKHFKEANKPVEKLTTANKE